MMRKTKDEAEQTRQSLLDAALIVFSRKGYADTRLEDIAAEANVTRGAIYHHFGSKPELYTELVSEAAVKLGSIVSEAIQDAPTPKDRVRRLFKSTLEYAVKDARSRAINELVAFKTAYSPELADGWAHKIKGTRALYELIADIIQEGITVGDFRANLDPRTAAFALIAYQNGVLLQWLLDPDGFHLNERIDELGDIFLYGIER